MTNLSKRWKLIALSSLASLAAGATVAAGDVIKVEWEERPEGERSSVAIVAEIHYEGVEAPAPGSRAEANAQARARELGSSLLRGVLDDCIDRGTTIPVECRLVMTRDELWGARFEWRCWPW